MMNVSTRNQFAGTISAIAHGPVNAELAIDVGSGITVVSVITNNSAGRLGLAVGKSVVVLVKASSVIVASDKSTTSANNQFCGCVKRCREGAVNGEVAIELMGGVEIIAILTNESIHSLALVEGSEIWVLINATNVIVAVRSD